MRKPLAVILGIVVVGLVAAGILAFRPAPPEETPTRGDPEGLPARVGASPPVQPVRSGPRLAIRETDYDFGTMETDHDLQHEFMLSNEGDEPLTLNRLRSTCGCCTGICEAYLPEKEQIAPGQSAPVVLQWQIRQYTGDYQQTETLATNDPQRPEITLRVTGRVTPTVRVVPTQWIFSRVQAGRPAIGEVYLYGYRAEPLELLGYELADAAKAAAFKIAWQRLTPDQVAAERDARSGCLLRIEVQPSLAAGPFRQQIALRTNVDSAARIEVPVEGTVGSELSISGFGWDERTGVLTLGTVAAEKGTVRKLHVLARGPHARKVQLKPVRILPDLLQVDVGPGKPLGDGAAVQIPWTVRIPPGNRVADHLGSKASDLGQIVLETGHPQQPQLRILVRFAVKWEL